MKDSESTKLKLDKKPATRKPRKQKEVELLVGLHDAEAPLSQAPQVEKEAAQPKTKTRKPRRSREKSEAQTLMKTGKVTKPGLLPKLEIKTFKFPPGYPVTAPLVAPTQEVATSTETRAKDVPEDVTGNMALAPALRRRAAWTPPRDTVMTAQDSETVVAEEDLPSRNEPEDVGLDISRGPFSSLQGSFGYNEQPVRSFISTESTMEEVEPLAKRRRIEVSVQGNRIID